MATGITVRVGAVVEPGAAAAFDPLIEAAARARKAIAAANSAASFDYWTRTRGWSSPPALTVAELDWLARIDAAPDFFMLVGVVDAMREALGDGVPAHVTAAELLEHSPDMPWRTRSYLVLLGEVERRLQQVRGDGIETPHQLAPTPGLELHMGQGFPTVAALDAVVGFSPPGT